MAETPGDIEREIEERRRAISAKIDRLSERVGDDVRTARAAAGDHVPYRGDVNEVVREHPLLAVACALGLGAVLGGVTPSMSAVGRGASHGAAASAGAAAAGGGTLAALLGPFRDPIQDEVSRMVRQVAAGFADGSRSNGRGNGRRAEGHEDTGVESRDDR